MERTEGEWRAFCLGSEGWQVRRSNKGLSATKVKEELRERLTPIVYSMGGSFETQTANAKFIVKAVNSHDAMYEALEAAEKALEYTSPVRGLVISALYLARNDHA